MSRLDTITSMTLRYPTALRDAQNQAVIDRAGNAALLRIYDGTQPATGGTATTLLAELVCGSPFGTTSSGTLTMSAVTADSAANASGTATWCRVVSAGGVHVFDGTVTANGGGGDVQLSTVSIALNARIEVTSGTIVRGNA